MLRAIQYFDKTYRTEGDAAQSLEYCRSAVDYLGGRILAPRDGSGWRLQVFYVDDLPDDFPAHLLPDGCRRVLIPDGQRIALGIPVVA